MTVSLSEESEVERILRDLRGTDATHGRVGVLVEDLVDPERDLAARELMVVETYSQLASIYDDYPTMVLAQANDLGLIPGNDLARFCRVTIGEKRFPVNTWGGMLSAGQPGGHAGGLNGISEAVLQLQHRAGDRQVKGARLAVATGYGMTMYRYGGTAAAAILERVE